VDHTPERRSDQCKDSHLSTIVSHRANDCSDWAFAEFSLSGLLWNGLLIE